MVAHRILYAATAIISYPEDFIEKIRRAKNMKGTKYLQVLSPCPVGWKYSSELTVKIGRLAFESCIYPLYEVVEGRYIIKKPRQKMPVDEYLKLQGRFKHLRVDTVKDIQRTVDSEWERLLGKE